MFGAAIFSPWEGWPVLDAAYFTFITLTTIGFGDLVPSARKEGTSESDPFIELKLLFTTFYCLFGN